MDRSCSRRDGAAAVGREMREWSRASLYGQDRARDGLGRGRAARPPGRRDCMSAEGRQRGTDWVAAAGLGGRSGVGFGEALYISRTVGLGLFFLVSGSSCLIRLFQAQYSMNNSNLEILKMIT